MARNLSVIVTSITPSDAEGRLDEAGFRRHLGRLRAAGVSAYVGSGVSGEGRSLAPGELDRVFAIAAEELKGHVSARAMGWEMPRLAEVIDFNRRAGAAGLEATHLFPLEIGHGGKLSPGELEDYYGAVIEASPIPVVLASYQTGVVLPIPMIERLANRFPQVTGFAYHGSDIGHFAYLLERFGERLEIHCGGPFNALTALGLGAAGFMGNEGNISPVLAASVIAAFKANDQARLRDSFAKMMVLHGMEARCGVGLMRAMKQLLSAYGLPGGLPRPPRRPLAPAEVEAVRQVIEKAGIPGLH